MSYLIDQGKHLLPPVGSDKGFYETVQKHSDGILLAVKGDELIFPVLFQEENGPQGGGTCRNNRNVAMTPGTMDLETFWPASDNYPVIAQDLRLILQHHHHGGLACVGMPHKEESLAVKHHAAGVNIATPPISQDPRQEDLISRKKGEGVKVPSAKGLLCFVVNLDIAIVLVEYRQLVYIVVFNSA